MVSEAVAPPAFDDPANAGFDERPLTSASAIALQEKKVSAPPPTPPPQAPHGPPLNSVLGAIAKDVAASQRELPHSAMAQPSQQRSSSASDLRPIPTQQLTPKGRHHSQSTPALRSPASPQKYKTTAKFERFLQRQAGDKKTNMRRNLCKIHQELIKETEVDMNAGNWGSHGREGLCKKLVVHSGSVAAAWRTFLDPEDKGALSLSGLCVKLDQMGFGGHIKKLWAQLDLDCDGFISLIDLDPKAGNALHDFRTRVLHHFGSTIEWWKHITSHAPGMVRLDEKLFAKACQELGYEDKASIDFAFKSLRFRQGLHKFLTLEEIDPQAAFALKRADPCAEGIAAGMGRHAPCITPSGGGHSEVKAKVKAYQEERRMATTGASFNSTQQAEMQPITEGLPLDDAQGRQRPAPMNLNPMSPTNGNPMSPTKTVNGPLTPGPRVHQGCTTPSSQSRWTRTISAVQRENLRTDKEMFMSMLKGTKDLAGMKYNFKNKYVNLIDAWREGFGFEDARGRLNFVEFCEAVRTMGYVGNLKTLFAELDKDNTGFVSLREFDPQVYHMIFTYKEMLTNKYGNIAKAWLAELGSADVQAKISEEKFIKHVEKLGWTLGGADTEKQKLASYKQLFKMLQRNPRGGVLFLRDFDPPAFRSLVRQDPEMISEEKKPEKSGMEMSFNERQDETFRQRWSKHNANLHRTEMAGEAQAERDKILASGDLESLKKTLRSKFGTVAMAWKNILDLDNHGRLSWTSFADACRRVGYLGDLLKLWKDLDKDGLGYITLGMFDKEGDDAIRSFRKQLAEKFGNLITGFRVGLDVKRAGRVDEAEFCKRFQELEFVGDPKPLFKDLQAWNGRKFVTLGDIEPRHIEAFYREDEGAVTVRMPHNQDVDITPKGIASNMSNPASPSATSSSRPRPGDLGSVDEEGLSPSAMLSPSSTMGNTMTSEGATKATHLSEWSRTIGHRFREKLQKTNKDEEDMRMGCKTLDETKRILRGRFGSIVTAWQRSLDADGNGRLSFNEFCVVFRKNSFSGDLKELWNSLGGDEAGFVTLKALDKDSWDRIVELRELFMQKFGGIRPAWSHLAAANPWIDEDLFAQQLKKLGMDLGPKKKSEKGDREFYPKIHTMFVDLMSDKGKRYLYPEDLDALLIGIPTHLRSITWTGPKEIPEIVPWKDNALRGLDTLKGVMVKKFGCIYVGWWKAFDLDGVGSITVKDFVLKANGIGFAGNMKGLLKVLGVQEGPGERVTLKNIDAEVANHLDTFKDLVNTKFGSFKQAWIECMDDGSGMLDLPTFKVVCEQIGYPYPAQELFRTFKPEELMFDISGMQVDRRHLYFEDFGPMAFSDSGMKPTDRKGFLKDCGIPSPKDRMPRHIFARPSDPAASFPISGASPRRCERSPSAAYMAEHLGKEPPSPAVSRMSKSNSKMDTSRSDGNDKNDFPTSPARSATYFAQGIKTGKLDRFAQNEIETKEQIVEFRRKQAEVKSHEKGAHDTPSLLAAFKHKHGTLTSAWRHGVDLDGNGRISFNEFCEATRRVAFNGNVKATFKEFDEENKGWFGFSNFAPEETALLTEFSEKIREKYGTYQGAFSVLDDNNNSWLEDYEIQKVCKDLEFSGDGKKLFNLLKSEKGTKYVTLLDLQAVMFPIPGCR